MVKSMSKLRNRSSSSKSFLAQTHVKAAKTSSKSSSTSAVLRPNQFITPNMHQIYMQIRCILSSINTRGREMQPGFPMWRRKLQPSRLFCTLQSPIAAKLREREAHLGISAVAVVARGVRHFPSCTLLPRGCGRHEYARFHTGLFFLLQIKTSSTTPPTHPHWWTKKHHPWNSRSSAIMQSAP